MERKYQYRGSATVLLCQSAVSRCRLGSCKIIHILSDLNGYLFQLQAVCLILKHIRKPQSFHYHPS